MAGATEEANPGPAMEILKLHQDLFSTIGSRTRVQVTHIENPSNFWVLAFLYKKHLPSLEEPNLESSPTNLQVGSKIIFKSKTKKRYIRGQILNTEGNDNPVYGVLAIDYGFQEENVPLHRLFNPKIYAQVPPLGKNCQLALCKPLQEEWTSEPIQVFKSLIGKELATLIVKGVENDKLTVDLINSHGNIADNMLHMECSFFGFENNEFNRLRVSEPETFCYPYRKLSINQNLHVRVLSGDSLKHFYVAEVKEYKNYLNSKRDTSYYMKRSTKLKIKDRKVGASIGAYNVSSNEYGRALITKIIGPEKTEVFFIDSGESNVVPLNQMVPIDDFYCREPPLAILCSAEENETWDNSMGKFLYPGYEFNIIIKEIGHKFEKPNKVHLGKRDW